MRSLWNCGIRVWSGLRFRLLALVVLVCAPLVILTVHNASEDRRRALANWPQRAQRMSQLAAREEQTMVQQTRELLLAVARSLQGQILTRANCQPVLDRALASSPQCEQLGILNTNRVLVASASLEPELGLTRNPKPPSPASRLKSSSDPTPKVLRSPHDQSQPITLLSRTATPENRHSGRVADEQSAPVRTKAPEPGLDGRSLSLDTVLDRAIQTRSFACGDLGTGSEKTTLTFAYPLFGSGGGSVGVLFAALDFRQRLAAAMIPQLPKGASWLERTAAGKMLWCNEESSRGSLGRLLDLRADHVSSDPMKAFEAVDARGVPVLSATATRSSLLASGTVTGVLCIPRRLLFAEADRVLVVNLAWLGFAAALAVALGWFGSNLLIVRPLQVLVKSAARLASGDFTVRTGLRNSGDELGCLTTTFDQMAAVLEQRELERQKDNGKLQALSHKLVQIQENERRHIARELHDEIGQSLTVAEMNLRAALRNASHPALARRLQASAQAVERVLEQVQDLSLNLRPSLLDDLGLEPALQQYTHRQANLAGLQLELRLERMESRLEPVIETECFRITQEALTNIIRHAKARRVVVELSRTDGRLHLSVRDDGVGFQVSRVREAAQRGASLGLLNMEERAALAGGGLELDSAPGEGTRLHAWFPLRWRTESLAE